MPDNTSQQFDETAALNFLNSGFKAIATNDPEALASIYAPDASFFVGKNCYRVDSLEMFITSSRTFFAAGGKVLHFDVRQPRVRLLANVAVIAFHYTERLEVGISSVAANGRGTAIIVNSNTPKIIHLHLTENSSTGALPNDSSAAPVFSAIDRVGAGPAHILSMGRWGTE